MQDDDHFLKLASTTSRMYSQMTSIVCLVQPGEGSDATARHDRVDDTRYVRPEPMTGIMVQGPGYDMRHLRHVATRPHFIIDRERHIELGERDEGGVRHDK
jgi:hypothetical protein